jgi:hypothetical protein
MSSLILKRGKFSRSSGQWQDEDYDVLADGKVVGRIYEDASASTPTELRWFWSITEIVPASSATHGHAATREQAKARISRRLQIWAAGWNTLALAALRELSLSPPDFGPASPATAPSRPRRGFVLRSKTIPGRSNRMT